MPKIVQISVPPYKIENEEYILYHALTKANLRMDDISHWHLKKRSVDARKKPVKYNCAVEFFMLDENYVSPIQDIEYFDCDNSETVIHIIGAGPAGMFAALQCLEHKIKPIIYERGKDVRSRRRDLAKLNKEHVLNPESNYCFGEGGAGTYSDGKLYTRSTKRGDLNKVLSVLVHHGAEADVLVDAHPHIGTNKLPQIITAIRETILKHGGEIHFESKLTDLVLENQKLAKIQINHSQWIDVNQVILATGHSAKDVFELLQRREVKIEYKSFSLGVRVEHPQQLINQIQHHGETENLPQASYALVEQVEGKGVYSFCMCPGGIIAPCATTAESVVSNGWSPSKRNNPYANSGIVVEISEDWLLNQEKYGALKGLKYQEEIEKNCWIAAGKSQKLPAQRLVDFVNRVKSTDLPENSYIPGLSSVDINEVLPEEICSRLRQAFIKWGKKLNGYLTNDAIIVAPESRTSSPVRVPRNKTLEHIEISNLYPCAEGAGYAGGIMSAAIDGMRCVTSIYKSQC